MVPEGPTVRPHSSLWLAGHEKAYRFPDFLERGTSWEKRFAVLFAEFQSGGLTKFHSKSEFGLHQFAKLA